MSFLWRSPRTRHPLARGLLAMFILSFAAVLFPGRAAAPAAPRDSTISAAMAGAIGQGTNQRDRPLDDPDGRPNPSRLALDDTGRLALVYGSSGNFASVSLRDALEGFGALPGQVSVLVIENGKQIAASNPSPALAVGSGFKLAVMAALQDEMADGQRAWDDVVQLQPGWKSLLGSILHDWPDGAPVTLHTLATLMIAGSDNSAADALIHVLGRDALERTAPHNRPLLTTREAFVLRSPGNAALLTRYRAGDERAKRAILAEASGMPLPDPSHFTEWPMALDIEWRFTVGEMCGLMAKLAELPIMRINPGLTPPDEWAAVAYKGGVDTGALSHTSWLQAKDGSSYCVAAIWNGAATDQQRFSTLYREMIDALELQAR